MPDKIHTLESLESWMDEARKRGQKIGFTCGAFDILHAGHVAYLSAARRLCDRLVVAVNTDRSIRAYKNPLRPIVPERERMILVAALEAVDAVVPLDDTRPLALIERFHPNLYIKGGDYGKDNLRSKAAVESYGGTVELIPVEHSWSTTQIIDRVAELTQYQAPSTVAGPARKGLVLLDRDGTLIRDIPFLHDPSRVELLPGVGEGLQKLQALGLTLVIVTNQQGIGLGYYGIDDFIAVNRALFKRLQPYGVAISRIYFCPHSLAENCECRKPKAQLLEKALRDFGVQPACAYFIGDSTCDMESAAAAGIASVLVGENASSFAGAVTRIQSAFTGVLE